jgi:hypothetical protein
MFLNTLLLPSALTPSVVEITVYLRNATFWPRSDLTVKTPNTWSQILSAPYDYVVYHSVKITAQTTFSELAHASL